MAVGVLGAAGFVGAHVTAALVRAGVPVIAQHRRAATPLTLRRSGAEVVRAPFDDPDLLARALRGHPTVVHAGAHYPRTSLDRAGAMDRARVELEHVLDACARAGVRRLVFVSSVATVPAVPGRSSDAGDRFDAPPAHGVYHDVKWWQEERVLGETRFATVVTCPGACLGPGDWRLGTQALLVAVATGRCPPLPDGPVNLIDVRCVAAAVARLATAEAPPRRTVLVSTRLGLQAFVRTLADRYRTPPPGRCSAAEAIAAADRAERRSEAGAGRAIPARELVDLVVHGVDVDGEPSRAALGLTFLPLGRTLDDFDRWARPLGLLPTPLETHP